MYSKVQQYDTPVCMYYTAVQNILNVSERWRYILEVPCEIGWLQAAGLKGRTPPPYSAVPTNTAGRACCSVQSYFLGFFCNLLRNLPFWILILNLNVLEGSFLTACHMLCRQAPARYKRISSSKLSKPRKSQTETRKAKHGDRKAVKR